jgi:hypothetical protein
VRALLDTARRAARDGDLATAVRACLRIKFIGPAFATKLVMMMRPDIAAVLDSVINERLLDHADPELLVIHGRLDTLPSERAREHFVSRYRQWCSWCTRQAQALNAQESTWPDWDGVEHPWRAADVERAFFAMGRERRSRFLLLYLMYCPKPRPAGYANERPIIRTVMHLCL